MRSWPLLVLAAPAAAEVWSGWVGIAQKTGFGLVSPLPGIWPSLHLDTTITLPVGVEAYAAYALRAWLAREGRGQSRTRRFAKWSAICSFALGMAGQIAYHLLAQAGAARAPWSVTTLVSCLPVLVLAMGTALAHMLRADARIAADRPDPSGPQDQPRPPGPPGTRRDRPRTRAQASRSRVRSPSQDQNSPQGGPPGTADGTRTPTHAETDLARLIASRLTAAGKRVSRRALRSEGIKGSNQALNALARQDQRRAGGRSSPPGQP